MDIIAEKSLRNLRLRAPDFIDVRQERFEAKLMAYFNIEQRDQLFDKLEEANWLVDWEQLRD